MPRVAEAVRAFGVATMKGPGLLAVSGGADSVAMLRALLDAGIGPLTVAHMNYQLRGADSDADEAFVMELANTMGVECVVKQVTIDGGNLEAAARRLRYDWFQEFPAAWIATGHTADDQAETVLHRLLRGTGVQGLRGIAPVRVNRSTPILRPLLTVTRADIIAYLAGIDQPYRTDASNADPRFTRNRIRHELLPLLRTFNPDIVAALGRIAEQAEETYAYLDSEAETILSLAERPRAGEVLIFDRATLIELPPMAVRNALRHAWHREGWPADGMTHAHWLRLAALTIGDYPGGISLRRAGRVVQLSALASRLRERAESFGTPQTPPADAGGSPD